MKLYSLLFLMLSTAVSNAASVGDNNSNGMIFSDQVVQLGPPRLPSGGTNTPPGMPQGPRRQHPQNGLNGGNGKPRLSPDQKQALEACFQEKGITLPTFNSSQPPNLDDTQKEAMKACHERAIASSESTTVRAPLYLSQDQQQALASCLQTQGIDVSNPSSSSSAPQISFYSALETCKAQVLGQ